MLLVVRSFSFYCFLFCLRNLHTCQCSFFFFKAMITLLWYILLINLTVLGLCQGLLLVAAPGLLIVVTLLSRGTGSGCAGISSCGAWASFPWGMWNLSKPGMESVFPALAGWFLSTVPPGKYQCSFCLFVCFLRRTGLIALWHVGSSWIRDWTHVSCIGRRILHQWATREVPPV